MNSKQSQPVARLQGLVGLQLADVGRAADLAMFSFGSERAVQDRQGSMRTVHQYALHVQCAWRLTGPDGIVVASQDVYYPAGASVTDVPDDFEWDQPNANRCDELTGLLLANESIQPLVVQSIQGGPFGDFQILFTKGYSLDVFPDSSLRQEHWRVFEPMSGRAHAVYVG